MRKLDNLHLHNLQLYAFGSVGQYALQRLLAHLSLQSTLSTSSDPNVALMEIFKNKLDEVKKINSIVSNPKNLHLIYQDFSKGILCHSTDIYLFDITLLTDILFEISVFPTSNPSFRRGRSCKNNANHEYKECCDSCDHLCSICKRKSCRGPKCCVTGRTCAHKCKKCNVSYHECRENKYICCTNCTLCLNCFLKAFGLKNWYELIDKWVKENLQAKCPIHPVKCPNPSIKCPNQIVKCPEQELRMAVSVVLTFRNLTMHLSPGECDLMDNGNFHNDKLPTTCKHWNEIRDIVWHSTKCILTYLKNNVPKFTTTEFDGHIEYLRCVAIAKNKTQFLKSYGTSIDKYLLSEELIEIHGDLNELKENVISVKKGVVSMQKILEKRTLTVDVRLVFPDPLIVFNLGCDQAKVIKQAFVAAVEQHFEKKQSDNTFKVLMPGFRVVNATQVEIKSVPLEFNISSSSKLFPWKDYEEFGSKKSQFLWGIIQNQIVDALPGATVECCYWKLGSIIILAVIRKESLESWTEEELVNIDSILPKLTGTIELTLGEVQCTCTRSKVLFQQENTLDFSFDIQTDSSYFAALLQNDFDSDFFYIFLKLYVYSMWKEKISCNPPSVLSIQCDFDRSAFNHDSIIEDSYKNDVYRAVEILEQFKKVVTCLQKIDQKIMGRLFLEEVLRDLEVKMKIIRNIQNSYDIKAREIESCNLRNYKSRGRENIIYYGDGGSNDDIKKKRQRFQSNPTSGSQPSHPIVTITENSPTDYELGQLLRRLGDEYNIRMYTIIAKLNERITYQELITDGILNRYNRYAILRLCMTNVLSKFGVCIRLVGMIPLIVLYNLGQIYCGGTLRIQGFG